MTRITGKTHDSTVSGHESNLHADTSRSDSTTRHGDTHKTSPIEDLRAIIRRVGGLQEARKLLADGFQQRPSSNPSHHTESLKTLVGLLAEQHSTQQLGEEGDGE